MKVQNKWLVSMLCAIALLLNGVGILAQGTPQEKSRPRVPRDVFIEPDGMIIPAPAPGTLMPYPPEVVFGVPSELTAFSYVASEMSFDSKVVKGAPYSAEAVTESVQTLADGNRIVRKTTASIYRDSEGRTRREQTLGAIGPFASAGDPQQAIAINDPVAGVNYMLEPRNRVARKLALPPLRVAGFGPGSGGGAGSGDGPGIRSVEPAIAPPPGVAPRKMRGPAGGGPGRLGRPLRMVEPSYPPAAKAAGVEGNVRVRIVVDKLGKVESAEAIDGHPLLQTAAVEAARQLLFEPVEIDGVPVKVVGTMSYNFSMDGKEKDAAPQGRPLKKVQPTYPAIAKAAGAEGPVRVQIVINEAGEVQSAKAIDGHPLLQAAAVEAARQWRFEPTEKDGVPVKVTGEVSFNFVLPEKSKDGQTMAPPEPKTESLGKQVIEGVEAEGTRTTLIIPANQIGNERPLQIVSERWYSPELQTLIMTKHSDPRFGETTYRLTNINRSEPAHSLFEVPADYKIEDSFLRSSGRRMRKPEN